MSKVIKLIAVVDEDTADRIMAIMELGVKERMASNEVFEFVDADDTHHKLHFVLAEIV